MTEREALKLALEEHRKNESHRTVAETRYWCEQYKLLAQQAIEVLAQEQKPVAWMRKLFSPELGEFFDYKDGAFARETDSEGWTPLYTTPPQRTWVGLTDEEILVAKIGHYNPYQRAEISFAQAIEAKLKEKNT